MDLLKQLETKLQTLVQQRAQLKEELDALKAKGAGDLDGLRAELAQAREEREAFQRERDEVRERLQGLLAALEAAG
ncbi:MAG TPA: cell division protein ZapB [Holophagaceae bacterium]|jgi:FtsZ-binding cell division protein ZapB|nr:cell division protein ZapB [Holophagaceae bacterium]